MKNIILWILLIFTYSVSNYSQWQTYNVTSNGRFYDVSVVDQNVIWASGDSAKVYRTTNGGINWRLLNSGLPIIIYNKVFGLDSSNAWIVSDTMLYRTTNSGTNWYRQFYSPITYINKIHFFNANTGYLFCDELPMNDSLGFFITRNGGLNWLKSINSPVLPAGPYILRDNGPNQIDTNFVYFFAELSGVGSSKFYKLTGGLNNAWQVYDVSVCQCDIAVFKNANDGIAVDGSNINSTSNGGINWTFKTVSSLSGTVDLLLVPNTNWVIHNSATTSKISYDFGASFQPVRNYFILGYSDANDTNSIWLAGSNGQLLKYNFAYIGINQLSTEIPDKFILYQNYPNPFNPETVIKFDVPKSGNISYKVYDALGKIISSINENRNAGTYEITFDGSNFASGIYYYSIETNGSRDVKKMVLLK